TVMVATLLSFLVSFTIVPWLYSRMGKLSHINKKSFFGGILHGFESGLSKLTNWISGILKWSLRRRLNKVIVLLVSIGLLFASFALVGMGYIGSDFFPGNDRGEFYLQMEINKDASLEQTNFLVRKAEDHLAQKPEIERMITTVGQASDGMMNVGGTKYKAEIHIIRKANENRKVSTKVYSARLKREMEEIL